MKVLHSWLKEYVGEALPNPEKVEELLTFYSFEVDGREETEGESVIDVDILPNRSSDALCHRGIARELASVLNVKLVKDPLAKKLDLESTDQIIVNVENKEACPRFTTTLFSDIEVKDSPEWLQKRLRAIGQRPINNIVDATNYVMYAIGEPLHAYDADLFPQVNGKWQFVVRDARAGEEVSLLAEGGKDEDRIVTCVGTELLIVDGSTDTPIGLAGVKGGRFAGVHASTKRIIIEAAHFNPITTRKTARRLGIVIDASKRFENEPSRELPPYAQAEIVALIKEIANGSFEGFSDVYFEEKNNPKVAVTTEKTNALLGLSLSDKEIAGILKRIGAVVEDADGQCLAVGPWERTDLLIEEDFIEEIGRLHGLDKIQSVIPSTDTNVVINARHYYSDQIRHLLLDLGFSEVITSSFHKKDKIQLRNALASDKSFVRGNLRNNIEGVLDKNFSHGDLLGIPDLRVFEIGTVFTPENGVTEHVSLALGARTKGNGYSGGDDKIIAKATEEIDGALGVSIDWQIEKGIAEVNLSDLLKSLPQPAKYEELGPVSSVQYQAPSMYPAISRDVALWVTEDVEAEKVIKALSAPAGPLLIRYTLFDTFTKEGRTSYAFRLVFQSSEKTLTDEEVNLIMESVYEVAADNNWQVR